LPVALQPSRSEINSRRAALARAQSSAVSAVWLGRENDWWLRGVTLTASM